jgi:hypothetical protein
MASARWEIPPGQTAASDPVQLPVAAGEEIAVTCYVAGTAGPQSFTFSSLYWITPVLTDAPADGPVIVAFGESFTRGDGTTIGREQRYPDHLQARMLTVGLEGQTGR